MTRKNCAYCKSKRSQDKMIQIESKLLNKSAWICENHTSIIADIQDIRPVSEKPVFVELFAGSGHLSQIARTKGYTTVTIDNNPKLDPDICVDIQNLRNTALPGHVDVIWASVPCTVYSIMSLSHHWEKISIGFRQYHYIPKSQKAIQALRILNKTLRLIAQLRPSYYFIENPRGAMRHMPQMKMIPFRHTVSYADYGFNYYKPTDIFTNNPHFKPTPIKGSVGQEFETTVKALSGNYERSLIPGQLINEVLDSIPLTNSAVAAVSVL